MAFEKLTEDLNIIQKLDDEPNDVGGLSPDELKAEFDRSGLTIQSFINSLVDALNAMSAAASVGFTAIEGVDATNLQDAVAKLQKNIVDAQQGAVQDGSISTVKLTDLAVTTAKLSELSVTASKLATDSVTENKIYNGSVTTNKVANGAVTEAKIGASAVTADKISAGSVVNSKLGEPVSIANGGTGATSAEFARANLGVTIQNLGGVPLENLQHETWTFTAKDGTVVTKEVVLWS